MFSSCFQNNEALSSKVALLKEMQIFKSSNQKRRASDVDQKVLEDFINLAFKATLIYDEVTENFKKFRKKMDKLNFLKNSKKDIEKIRSNFNTLYSRQKSECQDICKNKYIVFSHNIILSSELSIANKELELSR